MKLLVCLVAVVVSAVPALGQPNASPNAGAKPAQPAPAKPAIAPAVPINPPGAAGNPPPTVPGSRRHRTRTLGISRQQAGGAPNPWGVPPVQQQPPWGVPQGGAGAQRSWYPQPQPNLIQSMTWLSNRDLILDAWDVPCGMSQNRMQMLPGAVDHPDPYCECRTMGSCDGMIDYTAQANGVCSRLGAICCCAGTPDGSLLTAALLSSSMRNNQQFSPYGNQMSPGAPQFPGPRSPAPGRSMPARPMWFK